LEAYRAAALADPSNPDRVLDYTRLLMATDKYDEAIQVVEAGMGKSAATAPLQLRLGAIEMVKGHYDAARRAFHAALATDPGLDVAYVGLAETYARQANDAEALQILEDARQKRPGRYLLEYYVGMLANRLGREKEAVTALENAAQLEPTSPAPFFELGKLYASQHDWPRAQQAFEHVINLNPQYAPAHYQLTQVDERLGLHEKAKQEAERTRQLLTQQRDDVLRKQRERAASFQQQSSTNAPQ
jgi:tetratricopeptide (TPR) repeat protein